MAISFVGSAEASAISGGNAALTLPAMQQNDLVIVAYCAGDNDNVNHDMQMVTAGYTEVADLFSDDLRDANLGVFYKFMGASPDATAEVLGVGGADTAISAVAMVFRGVDTGTPMDVAATTATGLSTAHANPPSIDHLNPSGLWTVIAGGSAHTRGAAVSYTFPTGYTTDAIDRAENDTIDSAVGMGYRSSGVSDPEDPGTMTLSGTDAVDDAWCAVTMALRPATVTATRGRVSWAELEVPFRATRGRVSWAELEVPTTLTRGRVSWVEFEVPGTPTRGRVSWTEFEVPDPPIPTRGRVSWVEMEVPAVATRGRVSFVEFEVPDVGAGPEGGGDYYVIIRRRCRLRS